MSDPAHFGTSTFLPPITINATLILSPLCSSTSNLFCDLIYFNIFSRPIILCLGDNVDNSKRPSGISVDSHKRPSGISVDSQVYKVLALVQDNGN